MADPEIIDLTQSPILTATAGSQGLPSKPPSTDPDTLDAKKDNKKELRKRKRKKGRKSGAQSQNTTAANTRNNSEERNDEEGEEEELRNGRQVRRKHEDGTVAAKETSNSILRDRMPANQIQTEENSYEPIANGNENPGDLFFEDVTPAPLPPTIGNLPPPTYGIAASSSKNAEESKLLLPTHVSVLGSTPVEILPPIESEGESDTDYIKYLDYGGDHQKVTST